MVSFNRPMSLGDIFSETFSLLKFTFTRSIVIVLVFMIPAAFILSAGLNSLLDSLPDAAALKSYSADAFPAEEALINDAAINFVSGLVMYFISLTGYMLLYLAAWVGLVYIGSEEMKGRGSSLFDAFRKIFSVTYLKVLWQYVLILLAVYGCMLIPVGIIAAGSSVFSPAIAGLGVILLFAVIVFAVYLIFRWFFAGVNIVITGDSVMASFSKSSWLVKDYWWRTFGLVILLSLVFNIIISIISLPLTILVMWDFMSAFFSNPAVFENPVNPDIISVLLSFIKGIGWLIAFSTALQLLLTPYYMLLMYYDLRIRKNDVLVDWLIS